MSTRNLRKIFEPRSIAVIGASDTEGSVGYIIFSNLIHSSFKGDVFPINVKRPSVQGVRAYKSVSEIVHPVDLAVICTPASTVPALLEDCGKAGIRGVIVISAGFAEMGIKGQKLMKQMNGVRKAYNMRIIGPNCLGVLRPRLDMNASFGKGPAPAGKIAFISQSGALGTAVLDWAISNNIGFSYFVSLGSMLDVDFGDLIDYFGGDVETESIILYIEALKDARRFMSAARGFAMSKPIIVVKAGRAAEGARAAASHTGALAGEDDIYDAAFRRTGIVRVDGISDLFDVAETLALQPRPLGNRLAIITNAGGPGVMATDYLIMRGGKLAELTQQTMEELNKVLPAFWSRGNPVDILGDAQADRYAKVLDICLQDEGIDGALVILTPQAMTQCSETARLLAEKAKGQKKPIFASWMGENMVREGRGILSKGGIPNYESPEEAINAFVSMYNYTHNIELLYETPEEIEIENAPVDSIKAELKKIYRSGRVVLSELESKSILEKYGVPTTSPRLARNSDEAAMIAKEIGFPVVMKIQSEDISHKSDASCVFLSIANEVRAKQTFDEIIKNAKTYEAGARIDGVAIQKMAFEDGYELILGSKKDPLFGSVLLFGMGGIAVEAIKDRNIGFPPLNQTLARRLLEGTKIYSILKKGLRNIPPANLDILEGVCVRFSQLLVDLPEIKEIDINPLKINDKECLALDARMILDEKYYDRCDLHKYDHLVISPYPRELVKDIDFNGMKIRLRPIMPEDEPLWLELFHSLSEEGIKHRFFHVIKNMPHHKLIRYTYNDYGRELSIVAEIEENGNKKLVGVVRMSGDADRDTDEFAIMVRDDWQGKGIGSIMFDYAADIARRKGWKKMVATVLEDNDKMLNLVKSKGCELSKEAGENYYNVVYNLNK